MPKTLKIFVLLISVFGLCFFSLYITDWLFIPKGFNLFKYLLRDFLLVISLFLIWKFLLIIVHDSRNGSVKNGISIVGILISLIIVLEIGFSFASLSVGDEKTLIGKNWFNYYWNVNDFGYRDKNIAEIDRPNKKNIFIIGDSYVAGHGLKKEEQRFSNILRSELKDCSDIFNLGVCGADTKDEYDFLLSFPIKPDLIILSYVINDIYTVLDKKDIYKILKVNPKNTLNLRRVKKDSGFLSTYSFLFNFVDFLISEQIRKQSFKTLSDKYPSPEELFESEEGKAIELSYYTNDSLVKLQLGRIDNFIQYAAFNKIDLIVIIFPISDDYVMDYSNKIANEPIAEFLEKKGISVINFTSSLKRIPENQRHVNKFDSHPGVYSNKIIADTLRKHIISRGLYSKLCQ